jgi:hypothetical protein
MPTQTILLGRDQNAYLDGEILEGTRDFNIDVEGRTVEVTPPGHDWASTLVISADATITIQILWKNNYDRFKAKFNQHPPKPMTLSISNVAVELPVVIVGSPITVSLRGLMSWQVRLKPWFLGE